MMKNLLTFASVAKKTTQLLSTMARLRLLLVMFLTLTVSAEAWGADVTFNPSTDKGSVTANGTTSTGDKVTKSGFTITSSNGVMGNGSNYRVYQNGTLSITSTVGNITAISFTFSSNSYTGGFNSSYTGLSTTSWSASATSQARITKIAITYTPTSTTKHTVTLEAGSGSVTDTELTEASAGEGVTLPTPTLNGCDEWSFAGWKTTSAVTTETTTEPTLIPAGAYSPTSDITLYAVYQKTEGGGGSSTTTTFTFADIASAKNWSNGTAYTPVEISPITITANGGGNNAKYYISDKTWRMYNGGSLEITTSTGSITNVSSNPSCTFTITNGMATCSFSETTKFKSITVTSGGSSTTTYYHSTPDCVTETVVTLDPNGGAGGTPSVTATKGEAMPTITPPTRTGYIFQGYFTAASDGTQYYNEDGTSAKDWDKTDETFTLYAQWECAAPTNVKITGEYIRFEGDDIVLTVSGDNIATDATYEWKKGDQVINNQTTATLTINNCTISDAGNYTCTVSNGICSASNNYTVKMYRLRGLTDPENNWTTDFVFSKAEGKTATYEITLNGDSNYKFKVHDGSAYYGNNEGGDNPNPTMTHDNCTNWTMQENKGYNVILQTTITGVYTFVLDYTDESNPTISVTYPSKQTIYFYPGTDYWVADNAKFTIYSWGGTDDATFTPMEDVDCGGIYSAEISTGYTSLIFIRYSDYVTSFDNYWNKTIDLVVPTDNKVMYDRTKPNSTHLFLVPNSNWNEKNARFAAYFFDNGETWYSMYKLDAKIAENTWMCLKPTDKEYPKVIFCRMNPENTTNSWDTKWNQSGDLTIPTNGKNLLTIPSGSWDGFTTTWSTFYGDWTTYTPNHTVSFNANGHGTAPEDQCITDGDKATNPGNLSAIGYTFGGWYKEVGCTNAWDFANDVVTEDIILYAKWIANTNTAYTVKHYQENIDGTYPATPTDTDNLTGTTATSVTPAVKDYLGFTAPSTQTVTIAADGSTVVEYKYTRISYTLTWNLAGGEITKAGTTAGSVKFGAPLTAPTVTKSGLTFIGWNPVVPTTMPAENVTYTAIWENCIWVETSIDDINEEDVVVVTMTNTLGTYALNSSGETTSAPPATSVTVTNKEITSSIQDAIMWSIGKDGDNLIFHPITDPSKNLYCNTSNNNNRVRVGNSNTGNAFVTHKFIIEGSYLKNAITSHYIGIYLSSGIPQDWRGYTSTTNIPSQTLKFYKRVCLPEGQYWVKWMVNGQEYTEGNPTTMVTDGQITAIPDNPANDAIGDCADTFIGWSESNLGSAEGQSAPTDLFTTLAEAQELTITENKTFYAVFATASGTSNIFSRVTELSQLEDGNTLAIVAEQSGGQIFGTGSDHKGGAAPVESDGKITISVSTNKWILEEVDGGWKLLKDENNKLCADLGYTAYGNTLTIEDSQSDKYFFVRSSNKYLEYYSNAWQFYQIKNTPTSDQNGYVRLKIYKSNVSYSNYVTNCCALAPATNLTVSGTTAKSATLTWTAPSSTTGITKLQVRNAETDAVVVDNIAVNTITTTINGLTECTSYQYYVVSVGDCEVVSNTVTATPFSGAKTVNYDYNGGTGSPASFTTSCDHQKIYLPTPTRPGYTFDGWYDSDENFVGVGGAEYNPTTSPVTLYAHWTETIYKLTHSGSNYTNTENKKSIKSSETPFTLHYTCTGDYGLPATISITGGGKSWTVGTDYTWEVAADRQSATLVIKETVISADVTITINVATRYTVTFVHNDKGVFSGSETLEVLSSENTITLPTVTDVSCGFYDTFEGWIVADEDYTESTSKPAGTIYKGGANYTVNSDCTLRALYSKCEGDATQVYAKVTTIDEVTDGTYILVSNNTTPRTYSGHTNTNNYGNCIDGLSPDGNYYSKTLPIGAVTLTVTRGTGDNASRFTIQNGTKYFKAGSDIALQDAVSWWQLTTGEQVNSKDCPAGALQPVNATTYVMQEYQSNRFKTYQNTQPYYVFLYKLIDKCTKYYSTNPSCEKPVGVHIVYNANAVDASMSCTEQNRTYKVENEVNKYPQLASQLQFCTNATREGYTLVGWNTQANGQGTTYNINQNYYNLPVSGELDDEKWITLNLYAMWKPCIKFNLGNATGGTGVPDAVVENGGCVLPTPTAEQLGTIPCGYEFYAWSETSVNATQTKPVLFMPDDTYTGSALTLYAVYRLCEVGSNPDLFSLSYTISDTKYYVGPVTRNQEGYAVKFTAITDANNATVFGMKSIEGKTYKSLYWMNEETKEYMYWKDNGASFTFTSEEDDSYGWTISGTTTLTFLSTPYMTNGSRYLSADASEIGCPSEPKAVTQFTKEMASTTICTYATEPECSTTATLQFVTNGGTLNYPTTYDANSYQNLTPGSIVYLPTATFAGEWTFEGWMKDAPLESQNLKPETVNFIEVDLNITTYSASKTGTTTFYAVYSKTNDDKQFDPVNGGTYKLFAIGADGTKTYMPVWTGTRGTPSGVTTCAETGDYTITPGTGTHAGQYQITCGEYTLGVVSGNTDLNKVEGTWWNIEPSTSGKGTWRITVAGSTDDRALSCSFSTAKSFGNYAISNLNNPSQSIYRDMEIGECIYTEYTSTPENIPYITITGAPVKITSTNGERVYAPTTLHIEAHNFTGERIIHLSATNGFGVDPVQVRTNGQGAYSGNVKVYYEPTTDGDGQTINSSVLTASQTGGTNAEKISQTFAAIQGRNMPANFVIAAKWDGHWYALPANCTSSLSSTEGLLIEVNDVENPTMATSAPASAKYGLREVIPSRQTDYGQGIVFTERFAKDDKQFALYNGSDANIQVNAQYANYAQTNPDKYEWIPSTSDFKDYTLTNASTGRNLGLTSGTFGAYTAASNQVRLLPATFYEPAPVQVLKWKENSVIVMYTGAEATATTQVGDNALPAEQTLADQKLTHGIYELTTDQALTTNAGGALKLNFGANTRVELEIPLIISGEVTASANAHDVVILENSKLTAAATKYSYKDVYVYGGAKLAIPDGAQLGVNNIILRAGGVATNGAGQEATYQYIYPQVELKGTLTSSVQNIRYEYVTDYDHWYHLVLPFDGSLTSIHYPTEYYGDQVKLDNTGSWQIKRYDGATRATGNYDAWKDIEKDEPKATIVTAGKGYIFWGAPKKITANDEYDRPTWGIQRITMSVSAPAAKTAENGNKTIAGLGSYENVPYNSGADNDQGWNLIGNPYMVNLTGLNSQSLQIGQLIHETDASGNWTGKWQWDDTSEQTGLRYVTIPSDHFETYDAKPMTWFTEGNPMIAGRSFFVQIAGDATDLVFDVTKKAALVPALLAENNDKPVDIETGIILSNEILQDEVNFWIKDGKTNDYEYNADYPKTPNNNQFNIYGVHTNGDLSWVATGPEYAAESMPIGYQVPVAGTYMLSLSEIYNSDGLDALYVTDHALSPEVTVDIMSEPYEFSVNQAETNNERFTVSVRVKAKTENGATGLDNVGADGEQIHKFIYQDKMYILHHGVIYDATGKRVITINK